VFGKEERYGLALRIATALHEHRTAGTDGGHYEADEWWCCVQAVVPVVEEIVDEKTTQSLPEPVSKWRQMFPGKTYAADADLDDTLFPRDEVEQGIIDRDAC